MALTKNKMIAEIGRRTRLRNRDVKLMLETMMEVWTEELVSGGRIELENFLVMEVVGIERSSNRLLSGQKFRQIIVRTSKALRDRLNKHT